MKKLIALSVLAFLVGCSSTSPEQLYYEASKSISKDNTMTQTACWAAIAEIAKSGDNGAKVGAVALADKCKSETVKIQPPKKNWLGL